MADNTILNSGSGGDTVATDDIGGVKYPRSKIVIGADGTNDGDVSSTNPMPVDITSATIDVMLGSDFTAVFGTASLITATQADDVPNTTDGLNCTSFGYVFDGTTWDRLRGDSTNGVLVNLGSNNDVTLATLPDTSGGDLAAINTAVSGTLTVSGTVTANLSATDNAVLDTIETNTDFGAVVGGGVEATALRVTLASDSTGLISVDDNGGSLTVDGTVAATQSGTWNITNISGTVSLPTGAATAANQSTSNTHLSTLAGAVSGTEMQVDIVSGTVAATQSGTWTVQPGNTANTTPWLVNDRPDTSGGLSMSKTVSAASTNATSVKGSAGQVYAVQCMNTNASPRYLKLYDKASAPTVGTDTPVKTLTIPGNTAGAGLVLNWDKGLVFSNGIAFALTTGIADSDTGAVGANDLVVNLDYK